MKLLYVCADPGIDPFGTKGASTHVRETCRALITAGHDVMLVAARMAPPRPGKSGPAQPQPDAKTTLTALPADDPLRDLRLQWVDCPGARWLGFDGRRILLSHRIAGTMAMLGMGEFRPDAVYERYALYQDSAQAFSAERGWPRALEVNTLLAEEMSHRLRLRWLARRVERRIWRRAPLIVTLSHVLRRRLEEQLGIEAQDAAAYPQIPFLQEPPASRANHPQFLISPMAADTTRFDPSKVEPDPGLRSLAPGRPLVGYVGSLGGWHGADLLLATAAELARRKSDVLLISVGDTAERVQRLATRVAEMGLDHHLALHPAVGHGRVPAMLAALDACLIPETQEWSVPTKLFEYGAMARPIITTGRDVVQEFIQPHPGEPGPWAHAVEPGSAKALADGIEHVLSHPIESKAMAERARRRVVSRHTWQANAQDLVEALNGWRTRAARPGQQ